MSQSSKISWTDSTFNVVWGCTEISPGCKNCYARKLANRYGFDVWGKNKPRRTFGMKHWNEPLSWDKKAEKEGRRCKVFCGSMFDWAEDHPTTQEEVKKIWPLIKNTPNIDWQLLTKRADRIALTLPEDWSKELYPNVWLGVSIESNDYIERADYLKAIDCTVRFISYEPALGPLNNLGLEDLDWILYGGESGAGFRQDDRNWARDIKGRCDNPPEQGLRWPVFFFKQSAALRPGSEEELDGQIIQPMPNF